MIIMFNTLLTKDVTAHENHCWHTQIDMAWLGHALFFWFLICKVFCLILQSCNVVFHLLYPIGIGFILSLVSHGLFLLLLGISNQVFLDKSVLNQICTLVLFWLLLLSNLWLTRCWNIWHGSNLLELLLLLLYVVSWSVAQDVKNYHRW